MIDGVGVLVEVCFGMLRVQSKHSQRQDNNILTAQ